jgi:CTP:molybdopterin cytidylyltransferase MocA
VTVRGLLLAAGAGSRMGRPKALVADPDGTAWLPRGVGTLLDAGCDGVTVVLGAAVAEAEALLPDDPRVAVVEATDWAAGMSASLRAGLRSAATTRADGVLVTLVDLPDVGSEACRRVLAAARGPEALARATYAGAPGHPVLLGRDHWDGVLAVAGGDRGARDYLAGHDVLDVECGDLATGRDVDTPSG